MWPYVAAMPDVHWGMGSTVGSVIPTQNAIIPAAVGVDIGCGMIAVKLDRTFDPSPELRAKIEKAVPHGRTDNGGERDRGAWGTTPEHIVRMWLDEFDEEYSNIVLKHPEARSRNSARHLGTLGTGNHFIELSKDTDGNQWLVIHSGSRGLGNRFGTYFTKLAKKLCEQWFIELPAPDLAYLPRGTQEFDDYLKALHLAQRFAWRNREIMAKAVLGSHRRAQLARHRREGSLPPQLHGRGEALR